MPERVLISLEDVCLTFGGKPLFEALRMHICENDKICLVGKNGAGKTTLMRLILGELEVDAGKRFAFPGLTIGYLAQQVAHKPGDTVKSFVLSGLPEPEQMEYKQHLADIVMAPLELDGAMLMDTLSGGQLRRAALARALVAEPDILLLDEPTNHLDLTAIEWLESYLTAYRGALLCVSHDRAFLAAVSRKVFWIDRGAIRVCPGGYRMFDDWAEGIIEQEARELKNMQKKFVAEVDWTQGGVTGRRKRNQRRLSELNRLRQKLKADKAAFSQRMRKIELDALAPVQASKIVAEFKHVSKSFMRDDREMLILKQFDLRIMRGDRIGVIGRNGSGKSTFLKLLMNEMQPDSGRVFRGKTVEIAYFDQARADLDPDKSLWDTLCPDGGDQVGIGSGEKRRTTHVCGYLKSFLFDPKVARDKVKTLSGGQQNRLMLAKLLAKPGNVLILDEPTNDLDMDTLDMLQEILADYEGTLIVVSHDRDFLDRTVTEILAFEGDGVVQGAIGGYSDYQEAIKKEKLGNREAGKLKNKEVAPVPVVSLSSRTSAVRLSFKFMHELENLPARIAALEIETEQLKEMLMDSDLYSKNPETFDEITRRYGAAQKELEKCETRWLELEEMRR